MLPGLPTVFGVLHQVVQRAKAHHRLFRPQALLRYQQQPSVAASYSSGGSLSRTRFAALSKMVTCKHLAPNRCAEPVELP